MRKGFTLIELLVVVLIIGILAAIALPQYQVAVLKSRYSQLMVTATALRRAQDIYYMANGTYAVNMNLLDVDLGDCKIHDSTFFCRSNLYACFVSDQTDNNGQPLPTAYCQLNGEHYLAYYLSPRGINKPLCLAGENDKLANQVCQNMGGKLIGNAKGHNNYSLP